MCPFEWELKNTSFMHDVWLLPNKDNAVKAVRRPLDTSNMTESF